MNIYALKVFSLLDNAPKSALSKREHPEQDDTSSNNALTAYYIHSNLDITNLDIVNFAI